MEGVNDFYESPGHRVADQVRGDLIKAGLMTCARGDGDGNGSARGPSSEAAEIFGGDDDENSGYGVVVIPPDLFDADVRHLAYRIVRSVYRMEPARNPLMRAVYRMLSRLADDGVQTNMEAVTIGLLLGAANVHGVKIKTHPRDLAKEVGARYRTLLQIRRAAIAELGGAGLNLGNLS
ncbi:hypothetical protein J2X06_003387 [Lysobacter niastensis]|uniref:Uncharacterized protein n=1 Tax=Lysobacter niastensis TaxID=380629 RepID=A0ABU1WEY9_9GAMM|nr:hypothetical protein [Lysobacter niastensis]MDR7136169.1 hypothetical protein [Lysobacter niastensis]